MPALLRLPLLTGVLLLGAQFALAALAETPFTDPIPPAVLGRPLDQIRPSRPAKAKVAKPERARETTARRPESAKAARKPPAASKTVAAPRARGDNVGQGTHFARKPLGPGAYFGERHRSAVRKYYEDHPVSGRGAHWRIGERVPSGVPMAAVPAGVLASLPELPEGHRYVQLGGEVVLIAAQSKLVIDGISRSAR
jgi:Ni/Co efflux regulator RcnB